MFGEWLRTRRKKLDLTQQALADAVGCSVAAIKKIEAGDRRPSRQVAELLARRLGLVDGAVSTFVRVARGELGIERLPDPVRDAQAGPAHRQRPTLPSPATTLVGRAAELDMMERLLGDPGCRLLTLTGPGGAGKTRLALEAAHRLAGRLAHGAVFVSLVAVHTRRDFAAAIADGLGLVLHGGGEPDQQVLDFVAQQALLIVLDNVEHLLTVPDCVAFALDLLRAGPGIKLLATSRESLAVEGEWVVAVQGLPIPDSPSDVAGSAAVTLFIQRAQQARATFTLDPVEHAAAVRICQLVEGLPLGIELASAWVQSLSVTEIAAEIERDIAFLSASTRGVPERHRSITAVFDHSWLLLAGSEQQALTALSLFADSFSREAAAQVADASLPLLSGLLAKSLVRRSADGRFALHELVRQLAARRLAADRRTALEAAMVTYWSGWLARRLPDLKGPGKLAAAAEIQADWPNVRQAWSWMIAGDQTVAWERAAATLWLYHDYRDSMQDGYAMFTEAVTAWRDRAADLAGGGLALGRAWAHLAYYCRALARHDEARHALQQALRWLPVSSDAHKLAQADWGTYRSSGADTQAAALRDLRQTLEASRNGGDAWTVCYVMASLGDALRLAGAFADAEAVYGELVIRVRDVGDPLLILIALERLAIAAEKRADHQQARHWWAEALERAESIQAQLNVGLYLHQLARLALRAGDHATARALNQRSLDTFSALGIAHHLEMARELAGQIAAQLRP